MKRKVPDKTQRQFAKLLTELASHVLHGTVTISCVDVEHQEPIHAGSVFSPELCEISTGCAVLTIHYCQNMNMPKKKGAKREQRKST